jgi:gliding motility-associated-like protein
MKLFLPAITSGLIVLSAGLLSPALRAQSLSARLSPSITETVPKETLPDRSEWIEEEDKRTLYSSTYTAPGGYVITNNSTRPVNYFDVSGKLVPIDPSMKGNADGWSAISQPHPVYFNNDGSTALSISINEKLYFNRNCTINGEKVNVNITEKADRFLVANIVPNIDKEYIFRENGVKYNYIVKQPATGMIISEEILLPEGYKLVPDKRQGYESAEGWHGDLHVIDKEDNTAASFMAPLCYDAGNAQVIAAYSVSEQEGKVILSIHVPSAWMNDPSRAYPLVIDPLVVGPTTTWTGGAMPSCIVPSFNTDSIQLTIPAGISITGLYVTASFYADPFTTATMSQGAMNFSTNCGNTTNFTVTGTTGNTPGTAYLDSFNVFNPLMCCFMSSCTSRTFWLRMHLGRTGPSTGCNTTYIRYDPLTTAWPFSALVVGRTAETYGNEWQVSSLPICSNKCSIQGTIYARYGVPPYTVSHPWASNTATISALNGCNTGAANYVFNLTIPNCPLYCDTATQLIVPPPTVTDACGNTVSGIPSRVVPLKMAPQVTAPVTVVCSDEPFTVPLTSCLANSSITWFGNGSGTGDISGALTNTGTSATVVNYSAYATANGCTSDTVIIPVTVDPMPAVDFSYSPAPPIANQEVSFADISTVFAGTAGPWAWDFGDNSSSLLQHPKHTYTEPGTYRVCFALSTSDGCNDTICKDVMVIAPDVIAPNVITPNGDGVNDQLKFQYLEFFSGNTLEIYNRWGNRVFEKINYSNDWNGAKMNEGTYYYVLSVKELDKVYRGFFEILY